MSKTILIRADASKEIGAGHMMRQIALAQQLQDINLNPIILTQTNNKEILKKIEEENIEYCLFPDKKISIVKDANITIEKAKEIQCKWIVLDGYQFDTNYQKRLKKEGFKLLSVDDFAPYRFVSDIVLNQNTTNKTIYSKESQTKLLMGIQNVLLRREFRQFKKTKKINKNTENVMITMGGSDINNFSKTLLDWISNIPKINEVTFHIVIGGLNTNKKNIEQLLFSSKLKSKIHCNLSPQEMLNLMLKVDFAITAAGSTVWEYIKVGVPFIALMLYDNQYYVCDTINKEVKNCVIKEPNEDIFKEYFYNILNLKYRKLQTTSLKKLADKIKNKEIINLLCQ